MDIKLISETDQTLRQACEPWNFETDGDPTELVKYMVKLMIESNGIGLAAPQCGIMKRLFIMGNEQKLIACINPVILSGTGEIMDIEGCLSFPDLWLRVKRYETVTVKYYTVKGEEVNTEFSGLMARVYQHERDHLDGICFDTKTAKLSLDLAKRRRKKRSR